ncbi:MAG: hypothetical protein IPL39_13480 [Opitutaceae bacterium]|nr:hypothetical protein [Opitutaceae bacterium]
MASTINRNASLRGLVESVRRQQTIELQARLIPDSIPVVGYHIYGELKLAKKLSASENKEDAERCLRAIAAMTVLGEQCIKSEGGELFEAQGEIIHFFLPAETQNDRETSRVLRFATAFSHRVYEVVRGIAGDGWGGFAMAADFGLTIVLTTTSQSIISLGTPANRPAKRLAEGVPSGTISIWDGARWREHNVLDRSALNEEDRATGLNYESLANRIVSDLQRQDFSVRYLNAVTEETPLPSSTNPPVAVYAHIVRADLDGFSKRVDSAFTADDGGVSITRLVVEFRAVVESAERILRSFKDNNHWQLPWAGDCLNAIILPKSGERFADSQSTLPANFGAHWHDSFRKSGISAGWTIGVAGGDTGLSQADCGHVLVASIPTSERDFPIAVGWGVEMALRAQETKGSRAEDTVIPAEDYRQLADILKELFSAAPDKRFYRAGGLTPSKVRDLAVKSLAVPVPTTVGSSIPSPRPYGSAY